ncbi:MAG: alpha-galactosidase [Verrucomicrobia bacterium]|nr:alpha-galactosidase [Verrucomicrobiota bacterium]
MNQLKKAMTAIARAIPFPGCSQRWMLLFVFLAAQAVQAAAPAQTSRLNACWPAFDYDGKPSQTDGSFSKTTVAGSQTATARLTAESRTMTAADGKLQVRLDCKTYRNFPAEEYAVLLTNLSRTEPTGIADNFRSLKLSIAMPESIKAAVINVLRGSTCKATDFVPESFTIEAGKEQVLTTACGRSSNDYVPFLELNLDDKNGYLFAVGWTGSWKARFANTGSAVDVEIGMERTHFRLLPGETIRQPSITVFVRKNQTRREFKTLLHRFMIENKVPRDTNGQVIPPILAVASGGGNKTPQMMADVLQYCVANKLPFDTYWIDAGWYGAPHADELFSNCGPNWAKYVGDWRVNTTTHPTGDLLPIADAVHKAGLKFLLWFEPERMTDSAPILKTHPEYRHGQLVDFGNPETLKWIQDTIYGIIEKHKIDVYREDFNMQPGPVWRGMDAADRVGIAEAKHITGLYKFLDDMRARFPGILQENCASGGRRIDMEMNSRAHVYCRSDYYIGRKTNDTAFILGQNATLNLMPYLPFQGCEFNCVPVGDDYGAFSIIASGTVITPSDFDGGILRRKITDSETAWFKKVFDVAVRMRPFYMGEFHPLTDETGAGNDVWCAWQCNRPDLKAGFAIIFRRGAAAGESRTFQLGGIEPNAAYQVECYDGSKKTVKGSELKHWAVKLEPRSFQLFFYRKH